MTNKADDWSDYATERAAFPKVGDTDVFHRKNKPMPDPAFQGKILVMASGRTLSLFPKQIKIVAKEFRDNAKADTVKVDWISDPENDRHVIPIIQGKL